MAGMKTHIEMLKEMGVSDADAEQYLQPLEDSLPKHGIADSRLRLAHFFAQVLHESGCMRFDMENLNYSSDALQRVFGKYFATKEEADRYARNPEKIANRVYANRMRPARIRTARSSASRSSIAGCCRACWWCRPPSRDCLRMTKCGC